MNPLDKIVVSRKWADSKIAQYVETHAVVNQQEISLTMSVEDFVAALAAQIGSPLFLLTTAQLHAKLYVASLAIIMEIKQASVGVANGAPTLQPEKESQ